MAANRRWRPLFAGIARAYNYRAYSRDSIALLLARGAGADGGIGFKIAVTAHALNTNS